MTEFDWGLPAWVDDLLRRCSLKVYADMPSFGMEPGDLEHEGRIWLASHRRIFDDKDPEVGRDVGYVYRCIIRELRHRVKESVIYKDRHLDQFKATEFAPPLIPGDAAAQMFQPMVVHFEASAGDYTQDELTPLLPGIWDTSVGVDGPYMETYRDPTMPKGNSKNPSHNNTTLAKLADVQVAYERGGLTLREKQVLLLLHGAGATKRAAASLLGINRDTVRLDEGKAVAKLLAYLNHLDEDAYTLS